MTSLEQINRYLRDLQIRMRVLAATRGAAIAGVTALLGTLLLVWIANRYQFAEGVVLPDANFAIRGGRCGIVPGLVYSFPQDR